MVKKPPANAGDAGDARDARSRSLGRERPSGEGNGSSLRYSSLGNLYGQMVLAGCSPWGSKESDTTEHKKTLKN